MVRAVIREGRWVSVDETPLDPIQMNQLHQQLGRIHTFADGIVELTHDKIEILSHILHVTPEQERVILAVLKMNKEEVNTLI